MRKNVAGCESKMKRNIKHLGMNDRCVYDPLHRLLLSEREMWVNEMSHLETFDLFTGKDLEVPLEVCFLNLFCKILPTVIPSWMTKAYWTAFCCAHMHPNFYPSLGQWPSWLLLCPDYCKQCFNVGIFLNYSFSRCSVMTLGGGG